MQQRLFITLVVAISLIVIGCSTPHNTPIEQATVAPTLIPTPDADLIAQGIAFYLENYCGACHTLTAANTRGTFGPAHDGMGAIAQERIVSPTYNGNATTPEEYLRESLLEPRLYYTDGYAVSSHPMPAYTHLEPTAIDAMVYMLLHQ